MYVNLRRKIFDNPKVNWKVYNTYLPVILFEFNVTFHQSNESPFLFNLFRICEWRWILCQLALVRMFWFSFPEFLPGF